LPDTAESDDVEDVLRSAIAWLTGQGRDLSQIAISIPGFHPDRSGNPIIACDARSARDLAATSFPCVPITVANSIVTRTLAQELSADLLEPEKALIRGSAALADAVQRPEGPS
jgi:hypothetical protein